MGENYYAHLGYMPQDFGFYPDFTAREFMLYMAAVKGLGKKEAATRTEELLELVNLHEVADKKIKSFSGGMKQRLGIAQAELNAPDILILDEPTAGLDPNATHEMYELIASLNREQGVTVIMVTHDFPAAVKYASHILHIGHDPVFFGSTAEYLKSDAVRCFAPAAEG